MYKSKYILGKTTLPHLKRDLQPRASRLLQWQLRSLSMSQIPSQKPRSLPGKAKSPRRSA